MTCPHCAGAIVEGARGSHGSADAAATASAEERSGPPATRTADDGSAAGAIVLSLLGGFTLLDRGRPVTLQPGAQRVVAYTALQNRPLTRSVVAGTLWPDTYDGRAAASLRSALWRLRTVHPALVQADQGTVALGSAVEVDVHALQARVRRLLERQRDATSDQSAPDPGDTSVFETELLPGWWDEWVIAERERLRILQLAALEEVGSRLIDCGLYARALDVCLRLTGLEPLRETTRRLVIRAYLLQGNRAEALRHYLTFRELLWNELGILPSDELDGLLSAGNCVPRDRGEDGRRPTAPSVTPTLDDAVTAW